MLKFTTFIYNLGRKQAYAEIVAELESLTINLPRSRDGVLLVTPIKATIDRLKKALESGKN